MRTGCAILALALCAMAGAPRFARAADADTGGSTDGSRWVESAALTTSGPIAEPVDSPRRLAISGEVLAVGVPHANIFGAKAGAVYIFRRDQGGAQEWGQVAKVVGSEVEAGDRFGQSVAIDGSTLVVGTRPDEGDESYAYVFEQNRGGDDWWGEVDRFEAPGDEPSFGRAVAVSGERLAVGVPEGFVGGGVYIFGRDAVDGKWELYRPLLPPDKDSPAGFGSALGMRGDTLVVGSGPQVLPGRSYVYDLTAGGGHRVSELSSPAGSVLASVDSVGVSGDTAIVGAHDYDAHGVAYLFERNDGGEDNWGTVARLRPEEPKSNSALGSAVAIDGATAVVGGDTAYILNREPRGELTWQLGQKLDTPRRDRTDAYGAPVAIDGSVVVVAGQPAESAGDRWLGVHVFTTDPLQARDGADADADAGSEPEVGPQWGGVEDPPAESGCSCRPAGSGPVGGGGLVFAAVVGLAAGWIWHPPRR